MKYCLNYSKDLKNLDKADEINIKSSQNNEDLLNFLISHKDKRINLCVDDNIETFNLDLIKSIKKENPELSIYIRLNTHDEDIIRQVKEAGLPFYLLEGANCWDVLNGLIKLGVSDIFVVEDLGFELGVVRNLTKKHNIAVRVYPNVAQSQWEETDGLKKFFIRPEDVDDFEGYVDTFEFYKSFGREDTLYKIYKENKYWFGPLNQMIIGLNSDMDSRFLLPDFSRHRMNCGKRCCKGIPCTICENMLITGKLLKDRDLYIKQENEDLIKKIEEE